MAHRNENLDALSRVCNKDDHIYNRSFLHQKLALDTEELGTKSIALSKETSNLALTIVTNYTRSTRGLLRITSFLEQCIKAENL